MTWRKKKTQNEINVVQILEDIKMSIHNRILSGEYETKREELRFEALRRACILISRLVEIDYHMDVILKPIKFENYRCNCGRCDGNYNKKRLEERITKEVKTYFMKGLD